MYNSLRTASTILQRRRIRSIVATYDPLRLFVKHVGPISCQFSASFVVLNQTTNCRRLLSNLGVEKRRKIQQNEASPQKRQSDISIEDQYVRKSPLEHVLLRPGMYVGPNERSAPFPYWILTPTPHKPEPDFVLTSTEDPTTIQNASKNNAQFAMKKVDCAIIPALVKVFDEILVNAFDNRLRTTESSSRIDVIIDPGDEVTNREAFILVYNDGKGVPIQMHQVEKMYVPELIFGNLLTGSNFDDTQERLTGGRHGYGAKLANIFSKSFTVETYDTQRQLKYKQTWYNNMKQSTEPRITNSNTLMKDYTCVSFVPDLQRLAGDPRARSISDVDYAVMCRRVVDIAGSAAGSLHVTLNGIDVSQSSFVEYVQMYRTSDSPPIFCQSINSRWKVGVGLSVSGSFENVSFVNGLATSRGGTHINTIVQQLTKRVHEEIERHHPDLLDHIPQSLIRRHIFIFCDAQIVNPTFDSQMKECLTSSPSSFGSICEFSEELMKQILMKVEDGGTGIIEEMIRVAQGRQRASLTKEFGKVKSKRQLMSIPKLDDAHNAGTNDGYKCTLILTEGDSAKALAVSGLEVIGRKYFGVFPLRGKLLNVRDATISKLQANVEIKALCSILGLDFTKTYETLDERHELRYGHVMLMTDQDTDGSHIKGLVINLFRHVWPKLLQPPIDVSEFGDGESSSFMSSFITPLLKATKKGSKTVLSFYSSIEYNEWKAKLQALERKKWNIKYYKGLGTSTPSEAKGYFKEFDGHVKQFLWNSDADGEALDMVFDKTRAADRREWILHQYDENSSLYGGEINIKGNSHSYRDFVNKELIHFSHADNIRSIPNAIDGLKPSQRKVLYACFKRKLTDEIKVAQLSGYCAEHTAYHHGEASLQSTIIGMAQDYVGSNNINLLMPCGQFGTRLAGGQDAASPRYIFTHLNPITRYIFPEADDILLNYGDVEGQKVEPAFFYPIIPFLLVNGTQGIGTGWSTFVPTYNPKDVVDRILAKLDGVCSLPSLTPYAKGFEGTIETNPKNPGYVSNGRVKVLNRKLVLIDELPLGVWTSKYKEILIAMQSKGIITNFVENHTTTKVSFQVSMSASQLLKMEKTGLEKSFKLQSFLPTSNMFAFADNNELKKFNTAEDLIDDFFPIRMRMYEYRKSVIESEKLFTAKLLRNKARFIELVSSGEIKLLKGESTKQETILSLVSFGLNRMHELLQIRNNNSFRANQDHQIDISESNDSEFAVSTSSTETGYDYLLDMPLSSLTSERVADLRRDASRKDAEFESFKSTTASDLWRQDLSKLAKFLHGTREA